MNKINLNSLEIEAINAELSEDILKDLTIPLADRKGFKHNNNVITIPRYFYRFIGIKSSEDDYNETLYRTNRELRKLGRLYMKFDKGLNRSISLNLQNKFQNIWSKWCINGNLDTSILISLINQQSIIDNKFNIVLERQIKNNFKGIMDYYLKGNNKLDYEAIKAITIYTFYWINLYLLDLFAEFNYSGINPKVIFYGEITKEEVFYLTLLSTLGCDILYFNPESPGKFEEVDRFNAFSKEISYINRMRIQEFPEVLSERVKTTAYSVKEDLNKTLFNEGSNFYRPWQFVDNDIKAVTLKTTYEEINIWCLEKALVRDGWTIDKGKIYIPNIFAKVCGTHKDIDKYWKEINEILSNKLMKFYIELPIIEPFPLEYGKLEQVYPNRPNSQFDTDKLIKSFWWKYKELRTGLQRTMANKIKDLCLNPVINCPIGIDLRDLQVDIFSVLINLDMKHLQLLQGFDYPEEVPKIIIFNNEKNGNISYEDSIMLTFMNAMGLDIIIYNPSGYNDIEEHICEQMYDIHRLEELSFNLEFKRYNEKKGIFRNLFKF